MSGKGAGFEMPVWLGVPVLLFVAFATAHTLAEIIQAVIAR